jgi:hypothetical protein
MYNAFNSRDPGSHNTVNEHVLNSNSNDNGTEIGAGMTAKECPSDGFDGEVAT